MSATKLLGQNSVLSMTPCKYVSDKNTRDAVGTQAVASVLSNGSTFFNSIEKLTDTVANNVLDNASTAMSFISSAYGVLTTGKAWVNLSKNATVTEQITAISKMGATYLSSVKKVGQIFTGIISTLKLASPMITGITNILKPVLSGVGGVSTVLSLIPEVMSFAEDIRVKKELETPIEFVSEEMSQQMKFEQMRGMYQITEADVQVYQSSNATMFKGSPMTREEAIEDLQKLKKDQIVKMYGKKTFEALKTTIGEQLEGDIETGISASSRSAGSPKGVIEGSHELSSTNSMEVTPAQITHILTTAKDELTKTIRIKVTLAATAAVLGVAALAGTFASGGFSSTFFFAISMIGYAVLTGNSVYQFVETCKEEKLKTSDKVGLSVIASIAIVSLLVNSLDQGSVDYESLAIVGFWATFTTIAAMILHGNAEREFNKRLKEQSEKATHGLT
ncbi:hypothetical protein COB21_04540 [Candidatus Aerophobetes bacterium]|uniref:Uncharacterized protein n=1 Tax=Aerophobetes bacterium TaxID=2030807 RepID=A0A2A4X1Z2_UNCAE|nr:MAG: hypothetical protein COB21_04540 [Candidatus Aerophobetes bacterium]